MDAVVDRAGAIDVSFNLISLSDVQRPLIEISVEVWEGRGSDSWLQGVASIIGRQTQATVGWAVTLKWSRRRRWLIDLEGLEGEVLTTMRSDAQMACAWLARKVHELWLGGRASQRLLRAGRRLGQDLARMEGGAQPGPAWVF